jgi:hypothetical protein
MSDYPDPHAFTGSVTWDSILAGFVITGTWLLLYWLVSP